MEVAGDPRPLLLERMLPLDLGESPFHASHVRHPAGRDRPDQAQSRDPRPHVAPQVERHVHLDREHRLDARGLAVGIESSDAKEVGAGLQSLVLRCAVPAASETPSGRPSDGHSVAGRDFDLRHVEPATVAHWFVVDDRQDRMRLGPKPHLEPAHREFCPRFFPVARNTVERRRVA